ncbi:MAG: Asp23/Gls24 family envelope stress response protein [Clostridia bacterium]|nr:Asp23/Gls24 family envelope stress response protein [Clostridia bacterium]
MSEEIYRSTDGSCIISEEVIATIASNAALEIPGVVAMAQRPINLRGGVIRTGASRSVGVINNANETVIDVYIITLLTAHIPTVAEAVQQGVKSAVQSMTGSPVTKVNVHVMRAEDEVKEDDEAAE